jgi:hypothetical protein
MAPEAMTRISRIGAYAQATLILVFGVGCLHYVEGTGAPHHRAWAVEAGLPEPGLWIFWLGVAATIVGGAFLGFLVGVHVRRG